MRSYVATRSGALVCRGVYPTVAGGKKEPGRQSRSCRSSLRGSKPPIARGKGSSEAIGQFAQSGDGPFFELADSLARDAHAVGHLLERFRFVLVPQTVPLQQDVLLAVGQTTHQADQAVPIGGLASMRGQRRSRVDQESEFVGIDRSVLSPVLTDQANQLSPDCPRRVRAESKTTPLIEQFDRPHER